MLFQSSKNRECQTLFPVICVFLARFPPFWRETGALALRQHVFFANQQAAERGQQIQPVVVLGQAAIADFAVTEDLLDIPERMLGLSTDTGFDFSAFSLLTSSFFRVPGLLALN